MLLPFHFRTKESLCFMMEFYLNVYFGIYWLFPQNCKGIKDAPSKLKNELKEFKKYLDSAPSEISQKEECLPFFALPYVTNPKAHPSFKNVISDEWCKDLREKLNIFLTDFLPTIGKPVLLTMLNKNSTIETNNDGSNNKIQDLEKQLIIAQKKEEMAKSTLIESQGKWTNFCKGLMSVSKQIISSYENGNKNGNQIPGIRDLLQKLDKYSEFIKTNEKDFQEIAETYKIRDTTAEEIPIKMDERNDDEEFIPYEELDYSKLKAQLINNNNPIKISAILQALRWRITRSRHGQPRKHVLQTYINNDIFDFSFKKSEVIKFLLHNKHRKVVEYLVCLINVISSETAGVIYLSTCTDLITWLIDILYKESDDSNLRQNALGALQKFSLHRKLQLIMINRDLIKWVIKLLKGDVENLSDYTLEYATALLMNLALRTAGKIKCEDSELDVIQVLSMHLEHENMQVRTYINGTLYSILSREVLKERAKELGMQEMLTCLMNNPEGQLSKQINYIIEQLKSPSNEECVSDDNEEIMEYDENEDYETEEEEEPDPEIAKEIGQIGEELLLSEFAINTEGGKATNYKTYSSKNPTLKTHDSNLDPTVSPGSISRKVPSGMKGRPRIPKTPTNNEMMNAIREGNEQIVFNNNNPKNEQAILNGPKQIKNGKTEKINEKEVIKQGDKLHDILGKQLNQEKVNSNENTLGNKAISKPTSDNETIKNAIQYKIIDAKEMNDYVNGIKILSETQEFNLAFDTRSKLERTLPNQEIENLRINPKEKSNKFVKPPNKVEKIGIKKRK